ncbi:hypothetical protein C2845_PM17G14720 [Panicum miliaceum]|uniref:Phospholipid/glycerol acyltransferase domain-containing protein n=1 Tax=Panicum miliaceum TaxID=4540 RepID=A0A3L6Q6V7_PANMI|nr:hypothetical protein C2845_PM17G14720 [Panicum miliaceum]
MAKKKLLLLAHKLLSAMLSLLFNNGGRNNSNKQQPPLSNQAAAAPPPSPPGDGGPSRHPVVHRGVLPPAPAPAPARRATLVVDVDAALLRSGGDDLFPYFMLVALEAGGFLRGLALLLLYPLLRLVVGLRGAAGVRAMAAWLMEDVAAEAFDALRAAVAAGEAVCVTAMPRVMVEGFLREYLGVEAVVAPEMKVLWGFYTGLMEDADHKVAVATAMAAEEGKEVVGFAGSPEFLQHPLARCCKEIFLVSSDDEKRRWRPLPRDKYPKPMVFHDGRLAFRPTAADTLAMFAWLPFGAALGAARLVVALAVPYRYSTPLLAATGMSWRLKGGRPALPSGGRGQLFVCNHRTLIDPVYVSVALDRQVRAVSYSLSRLSELISPIGRTVRLTRDRSSDGAVMARLLDRGDLVVVCPEGTTCREPYLLRFSPLFAELSDDVVPVGIAVETSMFYATTAGGLKCFDPLYYMVNPRMCYTVQFLDKVDTSPVRSGASPSTDMANLVQRKMGNALGYGCTMLTRKDKYLMLAGNDGIVRSTDEKTAAAAGCGAATAGKKKDKSTEKKN